MTLPQYQDATDGRYSLVFRSFADAQPAHLIDMFTQRKRTFVDALRWPDLPTTGACLEVDTFDNEAAVYALGFDGPRLALTARCLPYSRSMVASLWPRLLPYVVRTDAVEISRLCAHDTAEPGAAAAIMALYPQAITDGTKSRFAVADKLILRAYNRTMKVPPKYVDESAQYPGLKLVQWS